MNADGSYTQQRPDDERVIDTQAVLIDEVRRVHDREEATQGITRETDLPDAGLLAGGETSDSKQDLRGTGVVEETSDSE